MASESRSFDMPSVSVSCNLGLIQIRDVSSYLFTAYAFVRLQYVLVEYSAYCSLCRPIFISLPQIEFADLQMVMICVIWTRILADNRIISGYVGHFEPLIVRLIVECAAGCYSDPQEFLQTICLTPLVPMIWKMWIRVGMNWKIQLWIFLNVYNSFLQISMFLYV